jgi:hypothetical protein
MANVARRILLLALLCLVPLSRPVPAAAAGTPRITGTFLQLLADHAAWDAGRWQALFASLRAIGITEVVVQWSVDGVTPLYASKHFKAEPNPALPAVLAAAKDADMRVLLGLIHDPDYWEKIKRDPKLVRVYFRRMLLESLAAAREIVDLAAGNPVFAGFYIPQEIDDRSWLEPDRQKVLLEYLTDLRAGLGAIAPDAPVAISGFSNAFAEPALLQQFWETLLLTSGIDRALFQDGIGVAKLRPGEAGIFLDAVATAARTAGRVYSPIVEVFTQVDGAPLNDKPFKAVPAPLARLEKQLVVAGRAPHTGILAFSLPEYCSPYGVPGAAELYAQYQKAFIH